MGRRRGSFPALSFWYLFGASICSASRGNGHQDFRNLPELFPHLIRLFFKEVSLLSKLFHMEGFILKGALTLSPLQTCSLLICLLVHVVNYFFFPEVLFLACVILDPFLNWKSSPWVKSPDRVPASSLCWLPQRTKIDLKTCLKNLLDILLPPVQALHWQSSTQNCYFAFASVQVAANSSKHLLTEEHKVFWHVLWGVKNKQNDKNMLVLSLKSVLRFYSVPVVLGGSWPLQKDMDMREKVLTGTFIKRYLLYTVLLTST